MDWEGRRLELVDEPTYTFGSADNTRCYPFARSLDPGSRSSCVHGVLLNGRPLAVFGDAGGCTGSMHTPP